MVLLWVELKASKSVAVLERMKAVEMVGWWAERKATVKDERWAEYLDSLKAAN